MYEFNFSVHTARGHRCQALKRERNFDDRHLCSLQNRHDEQALREPLMHIVFNVLGMFGQRESARRDSQITNTTSVPLLVRVLEIRMETCDFLIMGS